MRAPQMQCCVELCNCPDNAAEGRTLRVEYVFAATEGDAAVNGAAEEEEEDVVLAALP